ncbi:hypothetical protein CVT24_007699 [Panaeolus cyanescens]|uniref:Uncharacterized protein n=1 Tax=Panaeolus cyanescens TaxID=181874 RepID=A0A409VRC6_9AGAR|nr:hypothetical protein CVT24_007699 [Panaeolus cyanescens]
MNRLPNRLLLAALLVVVFFTLVIWYKDIDLVNNLNPSRLAPSLDFSQSVSSPQSSLSCSTVKPHLKGEKPLSEIRAIPQKRQRVAVASTFGFHYDVYLALAWTMKRVMSRLPNQALHDLGGNGTVAVYAPADFHFGFGKIVDALGLYTGEVKDPDTLFDEVDEIKDGHKIDLIVLGTCEIDLRGGDDPNSWNQRLLRAWDSRKEDEKFMLVCIVHNVRDEGWQGYITEWARRGAIRFLPISQHVANSFKTAFLTRADNTQDSNIRLAGYEYLKLDTHVPILNISASNELWLRPSKSKDALSSDQTFDADDIENIESPSTDDDRLGIDSSWSADTYHNAIPGKKLSRAVIQGTFSTDRREYETIFKELTESLAEDASVWGYLPLKPGDQKYIVDPSESNPFNLYLLGSGGIDIPKELEDVVRVARDLSYSEFYRLMQTMDICVPAFNPENGYYRFQASSTMVMALQCNVPILATHRVRASYAYADDDRVMVTRPAVMSEVAALRALRMGNMTFFWNNYIHGSTFGTVNEQESRSLHATRAHDDLEKMMRAGWKRGDVGFEEFRNEVWLENERVVEKLLRDL